MIKIKLSTEFPEWPIERQTPESSGIWKDCEFIINKSAEECDAWVVYDGILQEESVICSKENLIFITAEPETVRNYHHEFLNQFNTIITSNRQIKHKNIVYTQQALPWMVGRRVKNEVNISFSKDYDELKSINFYNKTKLISVISSNKVFTEGHRRRLDFVKALKEHFGDKIDVFGRGICDIEDKWDAIAPYKYHIALENSSIDDYWTEKLADCYLGGAYPFYYGCPNLSKYFSEESFASIDVNDSESSIKIIEAAIANNLYEKSIDKILESKNLILDKYNLFPMLSEFVQKNYKENNKKELITLKPEVYFINQDKTKKAGIIKSMIRPLKPIELFFRNLRNKVLKKKKINSDILNKETNNQIYSSEVDLNSIKGTNITISKNTWVDCQSLINNYTYIGSYCTITKSIIGKYCSIANNVSIGIGEHELNNISTSSLFYDSPYEVLTKKDCIIGNDVWIGVDSIIRRGVKVGNGVIVGANSFVNKDVPDFAIVAGNPAKIIKYRFSKEVIEIIINSNWWDLELEEAKKMLIEIKNKIINLSLSGKTGD